MSKGYDTGLDILGSGLQKFEGVPSICGVVMGGPQPNRGLLAGVIELCGAVFFPMPLRVVVGSIGLMRMGYGLYRVLKGEGEG